MKLNDTIVAQSTPQGEGAIGIIRLSGKNSIKIINKLILYYKSNYMNYCIRLYF